MDISYFILLFMGTPVTSVAITNNAETNILIWTSWGLDSGHQYQSMVIRTGLRVMTVGMEPKGLEGETY